MNTEETSPNSPVCHPQSAALATDEVFVLSPVTIDGVSIAAGVLRLVTPGGETVRVPVDRDRIGAVARALMTHPAVLLLAREGVALPQTLPVPGNRLPVDTALLGDVRREADTLDHTAKRVGGAEGRAMESLARTLRGLAEKHPQAPARTYADGLRDALDAITKVTGTLVRSTDRMALDAGAQAVKELLGDPPKAPAVPFDPTKHCDRAAVVAMLRARGKEWHARAATYRPHNVEGADALDERADTYTAAATFVEQGGERGTPIPPPFDPAVHVTRAEVVADLRTQASLADIEAVSLANNGHAAGSRSMLDTFRRLTDLAAKYEARA